MLYIVTHVSVDFGYSVHKTHEPKVFLLREDAEKYKEKQEDYIYYGWIEEEFGKTKDDMLKGDDDLWEFSKSSIKFVFHERQTSSHEYIIHEVELE